MKGLTVLLTVLMLSWAGSAIAQTPDEEEELDNAIQRFGYVSGMAFQCVPDEESGTVEREAMQVFTGLSRLFGTDRAFFYAAAYGSGATTSVEDSRCDAAIRQFRETLQNSALGQGGRQ